MLQRLKEDMKAAMKARDKARLAVIRSIQAELKNVGIEKRGKSGVTDKVDSPAELLSEDECQTVLRGMVKKRKDAAEQYQQGRRQDLVDQELSEVAVIEEYLPKGLDEAEIRSLVATAMTAVGAASMADMGKVMKEAQKQAAGRADGKVLALVVRELLS